MGPAIVATVLFCTENPAAFQYAARSGVEAQVTMGLPPLNLVTMGLLPRIPLGGQIMNRWKLAVPVVASIALASLFVAGCTTREVVVREAPAPAPAPASAEAVVEVEGPPAPVTVQAAPPPVQVEVVPAAPAGEWVWVRGHWHWNGGRWVWLRGRYVQRRVGWHWVEAHVETRGGAVIYVGPHWAR
jgi:hypothetical protein